MFEPVLDFLLDRPEVRDERRRALAPARPPVLEVGIGTGLNLACYPAAVRRVAAATRDPELPPRARRRAAACGVAVDHARTDGRTLPFPRGSFATVTCTFLLCSVDDPAALLAEMRRVLAPEGRLLVLEHVLSSRPLERTVQRALSPLHALVACGCRLTRETDRTIAAAGFAWDALERYHSDAVGWPAGPLVRGVARRG